MFEKSLYDLIRGLRNHKGNEREYIQSSIRECRKEIKSQDMDLKATAVLKLSYLEMFGHDMSWASFHILEVMSSAKYPQKRLGYLGAVQSFRPDMEVLMLAENLLKKDLTSPQLQTISLPLVAIPHVVSPSMANSLLSDLVPRLTHSSPSIRKKTIVTLYRLAVVYPETLRPAWPKIKERLSDENEDPSVTAAVVNVVCELGWRRPHDFLPLAPRLFDLLIEGSNNWMAIKIIKLFATLTPLEPRLVNKLLPPLTNLIKTTPAMSLLYECINGIIQGGILESAKGTTKGDEIARLCVGKLRGMLIIQGDPNLKYVALLAFNRIVELHPYLVTMHEDVVMECIDDSDISIRLRALDLVVGMVNAQNLSSVVDRLMSQLSTSPTAALADDPINDRSARTGIIPSADAEDTDAEQSIRPAEKRSLQPPPLPDEYRVSVIQRILEMCSRDTYANINDFDWYIDVLVRLVKCVPGFAAGVDDWTATEVDSDTVQTAKGNAASRIGRELRNIAVRVKSSRKEATRAAESLVSIDRREELFPSSGNGGMPVLEPAVWVVGEFADMLADPDGTMVSLLHSTTSQLPAQTLAGYLQAITKLFALIAGDDQQPWTAERKTTVSLLSAKIVHFMEPLTTHPNIEVQERAVEYLELARLATEAIASHRGGEDSSDYSDPPLFLTQAIPSLFAGMELNPVASDAQKRVPVPEELDLEKPINENLTTLLQVPQYENVGDTDEEFYLFYHQKPQHQPQVVVAEPAANRIPVPDFEISYQQSESEYLDPELAARRKLDRTERYRDDPFYIPAEESSGQATPSRNTMKPNNGTEADVDSIPIMELDLGSNSASGNRLSSNRGSDPNLARQKRRNLEILGDETIGDTMSSSSDALSSQAAGRSKRSLLQVDSSGLGAFSLEANRRARPLDIERTEAEEAEMAAAMKEVERLRLEMQRNAESIEVVNGPPEGTVVKKKKKKKKHIDPTVEGATIEPGEEGEVVALKTKKKAEPASEAQMAEELDAGATVKPKKKKKRREILFEDAPTGEG